MKRIYYFIFLVCLLNINNTDLMAQTPTLQTQTPVVVTPYIYQVTPTSPFTYDAKVTFVGQVNPNGEECSTYFQYGPTTSYGDTVAASPAIVAGTDNTTLAATTVIHNCGGDYHCRLCVVSGGVTYYGSDIQFAPEVDPTVKLFFTANPSDDPITTSFSIQNNNYFPVSITCTDGTNTDTLNIAQSATQDFTCNKLSTVSFSYNYTNPDGSTVYPFLFRQMPTNDQTMGDTPSAQTYISIQQLGYTANKDSVWYNIKNANDADVSLLAFIGDGYFQSTTVVGQHSNKIIETPYDDATFYFNNINISAFSKPLVKTTFAYVWIGGGYNFVDMSSPSCFAYPQKVYLDASDNLVTSKIISNFSSIQEVPYQSWINGGNIEFTYPFNTPLSMSIGANTTGQTRTGTIEVVSSLCYVTIVQSGLTVPKNHLKLRLRADQGVTSSGDSVSVWGDMSGNGNNATQSTDANRPVVIAGAINNMSALRFNGSGSYLVLPTSAALGIQNHDYEIFVVARSSSSNIQFLLSGNSSEQFEYQINDVGARFIPITATYLDEGTSGAYADGKPHVFEAHASSTGGGMSVDGVNGGTSTANILSSDGGQLRLGVRSGGTYYFNGDIAEVLVYDTVLTSAQRDSVEHYLSARYGITSGALPVELTSFTATSNNSSVTLNWETATEVNNYGFEVQRSQPEAEAVSGQKSEIGSWNNVGYVKGSGNSNSPKSYSFVDSNPAIDSAEYRLKQIDNDGSYKYSNVVTVKLVPVKYILYQNYPNPFNPTTIIKYDLPKQSKVELKVYNMLGQIVATLVNEVQQAGRYNVQFDADNLASGVYIYQLQEGNYMSVKKFVLLK